MFFSRSCCNFFLACSPHLATFGIQTGRERERGPLAHIHIHTRDYQRGGVGGARKQRQWSSRQINLRRDLRSRTSLSACVYARAHLQVSHVRARLYRSGLSSIAMEVSEGTPDLTIRGGVWTSCYWYHPNSSFVFHGKMSWWVMAIFIMWAYFIGGKRW